MTASKMALPHVIAPRALLWPAGLLRSSRAASGGGPTAAALARTTRPVLAAARPRPALGRLVLPVGSSARLRQQQCRHLTGPVGPATANAAASLDFPDGSMSAKLLERCMDAAVSRGVDVTAEYTPWIPVDLMQTLLVDVHEAAGCSWFMAIVFACLGIRVLTLPVSIAALRSGREKAVIQPQFSSLMEKQRQLTAEGEQEKLQAVQKQLQEFTNKHGKFFMFKGMSNLVFFQMPLYITAFAAMRGFAGHPDLFPGFAMEAPLWLESLALPDPHGFLPLFTAAIMLTNAEIFGSIDTEMAGTQDLAKAVGGGQDSMQSAMTQYQPWLMRGAAIAFVPMTWSFPAGVFVFMSTNLLSSTVQNRVLRHPALERLLEIPPRPEAVKEVAAKLDSSRPVATLALGETLRQNSHRAAARAVGSEATASHREPQTRETEEAEEEEDKKVPLVQKEVELAAQIVARQTKPQFSLQRARPVTHAELA